MVFYFSMATPTLLSVTSTPLFMFTPFPTTTSSPTTSGLRLIAAGVAAAVPVIRHHSRRCRRRNGGYFRSCYGFYERSN